jgi:hypothetical protein
LLRLYAPLSAKPGEAQRDHVPDLACVAVRRVMAGLVVVETESVMVIYSAVTVASPAGVLQHPAGRPDARSVLPAPPPLPDQRLRAGGLPRG